MAKDRVVFLSTDPEVQDKISQLAGFSTIHSQLKLSKAKIDNDFWHRPGATLQDTTLEDLHLKVDASNIKDIAIVSSKDDLATNKQPETFYVRVQQDNKTYVAVSLNASYDDIKRNHFNFGNPNGSTVIQKAVQAKKVVAVVGVDKKMAPIEIVVRAATGVKDPVFMGEGHVLNYLGQQSTEKRDYMQAEKTEAVKEKKANDSALLQKPVPSIVIAPPQKTTKESIKDFSKLAGLKAKLNSDVVNSSTQAITSSNKALDAEPVDTVEVPKQEKRPLPTFAAKEDVYAFERRMVKRLANAIEEQTNGHPVEHVSKNQANVLHRLILLKMAGVCFKNNTGVDYDLLRDMHLFDGIGIEPTKIALEKLQEKRLLTTELDVNLAVSVDVQSIINKETKEILKVKDPKTGNFRPPLLYEWLKLAVDKPDFSQESPRFSEDKKQQLEKMPNTELAKFFRPVNSGEPVVLNGNQVGAAFVNTAHKSVCEDVNVNGPYCNKLPQYEQNKLEVTEAQLKVVLGALWGMNAVDLKMFEKLAKGPFLALIVKN